MSRYKPKCWGFDDNGAPNGKCKKPASECRFGHPGTVDWEKGKRLPNKGGHQKSDSFTRRDSNYSDSWESPSDAHPPALTSTNTIQLPETGNRWGTQSSTPGDKPSQASESNMGWSKSSGDTQRQESTSWGKSVESTSWGSKSESTSWGNSDSSGWGSSGWGSAGWGKQDKSTDSVSGWGNSGTDADNPWANSTSTNSWPERPNSGSGWGAGTGTGVIPTRDTKGKGKARADSDVSMRAPSSPKTPPPPRPRHPSTTSAKSDIQSSELNPRRPSVTKAPRPSAPGVSQQEHSINKHLKTPISEATHIPVPKTAESKTSQPEDLRSVYKELAASKNSKIMSSKSQSFPIKYVGGEGRRALYNDIIISMEEAVFAQVAYYKAKTKFEKWKTYHETSPAYSHASLATRKILEDYREEYRKIMTDAKTKRDTVLVKLCDLPDFLPEMSINNPTVTKEMVIKYTEELGSWFLDLKIHERLAVEKQEQKLRTKSLGSQSDQTNAARPPTARELLDRGSWDWKDLKAALKLADDTVTVATEQVYTSVWTNQEFLDEQFRQLPNGTESIDISAEPQTLSGDYSALENKLKTIDEHISVQSEQAAKVLTTFIEMDEEITLLKIDTEDINRLCDEAEQQFARFEKEKIELHQEAEQLKAELEVLHLHQWSTPESTSSEVPDTTVQSILDQILPHYQKLMQDELQQILNLLRQRGLENQAEMGKQVEEILKPLLEKMDEIETICQAFMMKGGVTQDPSPPIAPSLAISAVP